MTVCINYKLKRDKNKISETKRFYILLILLIAVSIYCYLIKYKVRKYLIYDISYKTSTGAKLFGIMFDEIDGFFKSHDRMIDRIRYLVLFYYGWCDKICHRIKYLIVKKVVLQIVLIIILQESVFRKNIDFS